MIVEQYGIRYTRVSEGDLETLRYWRNQLFIRNTMQFREYISPSMQKKWFSKINNKNNYYFIIHHEAKKIGLINCKESAVDARIAEGGIFIWDKKYWGSSLPALASLTMLQGVFDVFKSGEMSIATVACDNKKAIDFNIMLGYEITGKTSDGNCHILSLSKERYKTHCSKLIKAAGLFSHNQNDFKLYAEVSSLQTDEINNYILKTSPI